ncbi:MAG: Xaa-Pro dipeptidase [Flavobacterium sp.]|jgi:Xaa-Pro dipeptidase
MYKADGSLDDNDRVEIGPTKLAFDEWSAAKIEVPNLSAMREFRLHRLAKELCARDCGGILLFDPLNIRYASDTTNMQLWNTHNYFRACFVSADGYMILWDYKSDGMLTSYNPLIKETRDKAAFFYFCSGDKTESDAQRFAAEVNDVVIKHCGNKRTLAVDKVMIHGLRALEAQGLDILDGEELMEKTRSIKGEEEIRAMRCAIYSCEVAISEMHKYAAPGMSENDVWAILHAENIRRGGEWIETRLLSSGPRTNPWFQECGPRIIQNNELLAFDTDLIGCYGMCADISRTWFIGDGEPDADQCALYTEAYAQICENIESLEPGKSMTELTFGGRQLHDDHVSRRYSLKMHGVGLCDEWPSIYYPQDFREGAYAYCLEPGMVICVETYIGELKGKQGVKLEEQVLITETGCENLTHYPFEEKMILK